MKPAFREATAGHEDQMYKMAKMMLSLPDTSMTDFIDAEQAGERIRDGYAEYFRASTRSSRMCFRSRHTSTASTSSSSTGRPSMPPIFMVPPYRSTLPDCLGSRCGLAQVRRACPSMCRSSVAGLPSLRSCTWPRYSRASAQYDICTLPCDVSAPPVEFTGALPCSQISGRVSHSRNLILFQESKLARAASQKGPFCNGRNAQLRTFGRPNS